MTQSYLHAPSVTLSKEDRSSASSAFLGRVPPLARASRSVPSADASVALGVPSVDAVADLPSLPGNPVAADATDGSELAVVGTSATSVGLLKTRPPEVVLQPLGKSSSQSARASVFQDQAITFGRSKKLGAACMIHTQRGFTEVLVIGSPASDSFVRSLFRSRGLMLKKRDLQDINDDLRSIAEEGIDVDLYTRTAPLANGGVVIDLCDGQGTTVNVDATGVRIGKAASDTLFLRSVNALALPKPADHGDYRPLRAYCNLEIMSFQLLIAIITYTIAHPKVESSKYVFLVLKGSQGTGKSVASKIIQKFIDPTTTGAQTLPGTPRDLAIMSQQAHLLVFDNLRDLSPAMSDALCIAATGGTIAMRQLYSDDTQKNLYLHGAILFNGIHPFIGQSDLADRCLVLNLKPLDAQSRKSEQEMLAGFQNDYPVIQRGLYDLISKIFQKLPIAKVTSPSRMVDFCRWLSAMELAIGCPAGSLQDVYDEFIHEMQLESLQDNPLAAAILSFAEKMSDSVWTGTPSHFYDRLEALVSFSSKRSIGWPANAAVMSKRLHGLQAPLRSQGISIELTRGKDRQIVVTVPKPLNPSQTALDEFVAGFNSEIADF